MGASRTGLGHGGNGGRVSRGISGLEETRASSGKSLSPAAFLFFLGGWPHIFCSANNLPRTCLKQEPLPSVKGGCFASSPKTCYITWITQRQFKKAKRSGVA